MQKFDFGKISKKLYKLLIDFVGQDEDKMFSGESYKLKQFICVLQSSGQYEHEK